MAKTLTDINGLISYLNGLGYKKVSQLTKNKVAILTEENRIDVLQNVATRSGGKYDPTPLAQSSVGQVTIGNFVVLAKPLKKQGIGSVGLGNEKVLVDTINKACSKGPVNLVFYQTASKIYRINGCIGAESVGRDTANRKKADVILTDQRGNKFPISVKKDNAEIWESADSYYGDKALQAIEIAIKTRKTTMSRQKGYYKIEPNIAIKATPTEMRNVVFGSDILTGRGAIITKTYSSTSFVQKGDTLTIKVTDIITNMADIGADKKVYFLIRNDKTRRTFDDFPGIRVLAVYKSRINKQIELINL